jgi:two-component system NtrC family sensor kinase
VKKLFNNKINFRSTIYGQVVFTITILSVFLFVSFGLIFRSVNEKYLNTVIQERGNNIGSIVEGSLYHSMLKNDRSSLQNTLETINRMPGIEAVNMYDNEDNLVHSSFSDGTTGHNNPNCKACHPNIRNMFPRKKKSFQILNIDSECRMSLKDYNYRLLLIRSPIVNEKSCFTSACHAHKDEGIPTRKAAPQPANRIAKGRPMSRKRGNNCVILCSIHGDLSCCGVPPQDNADPALCRVCF